MKIETQDDALHVVGIALRTTNDEAMSTIPPHWQRFGDEGVLSRIPARQSADVYAVYGEFDHAGRDNTGRYTLVLGAAVDPAADIPPGMVRIVVPAGRRAVFAAASAQPADVVDAWRAVWRRSDLPKTFVADYERYHADGRVDLGIGLHPES